jgi:hypothetical protein
MSAMLLDSPLLDSQLLDLPQAAIVPLGAGILQSLRVEFRPICDGRESISPDGRWVARAMSTYGPCPRTGSKSCYEFVVENNRGTRLQQIKVPVPRDDLINWRLEGSIAWSGDSSAVAFEFHGKVVTVLIDGDG